MNDFIKGFSRGLGYGAANKVMKIAENVNCAYQANKINNIQNTPNGYLRQSTKLSAWFWVFAVLTFPYLTMFWIPIYGMIRIKKKNTKISYIETIPTHISDRRYNCGYRTEWVSQIKTDSVEATDEEIQIYKKQGKWMIIPFIILFIFSIIILIIS